MHRCDPATNPRGGLITLERVARVIIAALAGELLPDVVIEVDRCQRCRTLFVMTLAGAAALVSLETNDGARLFYEMRLAAIQAAIERGEIESHGV